MCMVFCSKTLLPRLVSREHMSQHVFAQSVASDKGFNTPRVSAVPLGAPLCAPGSEALPWGLIPVILKIPTYFL